MLTAIIPARGGSKGILRKNLRKINGRTLVEICVAKCMEVADRVVVSSDSSEILDVAAKRGAEVLRRPDDLATDSALTMPVVAHAVDWFGLSGDILLVQCTAPLVDANDLGRCVDERGDADLSVLCHPFHGFILDEFGAMVNRSEVSRRQDMSDQYIIAGSAWAFDASYATERMYSGKIKPVTVGGFKCDIDTVADLRLATLASQQMDYPLRVE